MNRRIIYIEAIQKVARQSLDIKWTQILRAEIKLALHVRANRGYQVLQKLPILNCIMYPDLENDCNPDANWNFVSPPLSPGYSLVEDCHQINECIDPKLLPVGCAVSYGFMWKVQGWDSKHMHSH